MAQQVAAAPTATTVTVAAPVADAVTLKLIPKRKKKKSVKWAEGVEEVDEFSGKRKSKKCCIFHKQRVFGEWSDDEDSGDECDCGPGGSGGNGGGGSGGSGGGGGGGGPNQQPPQPPQPNANGGGGGSGNPPS